MPPKGPRLTALELGMLRAWIDQGASWAGPAGDDDGQDWWSLRPLHRPAVPGLGPGDASAGVRNPIDVFVRAKLREKGLAPSPEADRRTLSRRLYFDLLGLPPGPDEIDAFVADPAPDAYERLVDRLLCQPPSRRALGAALAGRGPLRRHPRLRQGQAAAERLAVPRLRHPRVQRGQAVRAIRPGADGRRRALSRARATASRRWGSSPPGRGTSSATPRCRRRRSTAKSPAISTGTTWSPTRSTRSSA